MRFFCCLIQDKLVGYLQYLPISMTKHASQSVLGLTVMWLLDMEFLLLFTIKVILWLNLEIHKERIGCYFCSDIVTPQNTMKDRTLDQMCTVTRPGLSFVSSAYASELYISLIHHELEQRVWANEDPEKL